MSDETLLSNDRVADARSGRWAGVTYPPRLLEIQPTARCHRVCSFCSHILRNQTDRELSSELIEKLLEAAERMRVEQICFSGGGEPLIWAGGHLPSVVARAASFTSVSLTTSGDQLWDDEAESLSALAVEILPYVNDLLLNVPAVDDNSMRKLIIRGPTWGRVKKLLLELTRNRNESGLRYKVHCVVVITRSNWHQLMTIDRELQGTGIDSIYYKNFKAFEARRTDALRVEGEVVRDFLISSTEDGKCSPHLRRFLASLEQYDSSTSPCWMNRLGLSAIVDPNGDVYLCTPTVGDQRHKIGCLYDKNFEACWGGMRRQQVLQDLSCQSAAGECPVECRYHSHNRTINKIVRGETTPDTVREHRSVVNAGLENSVLGS